MYIYINNQGKITTQIEHGEPVRQGNRLRLVVCFRTDNEIAMNAAGLGVKFRLVDKSEKWSYEYDFPNGHINKFDKLKSSEITYDLIPDEEYLMFESIFDVNEFTTLYNGQLQCVFILRNENRETIEDYLQDRAEITVNRTYGYILPATVITPEEKDELMASILSKLDHTGGTANNLTVNNGRYFGTQEFRNTSVLIKDAESAYEPTSLQQVVGLINTNNETVIEDKLNEKVDKISGKGLSTNDFTNQYKQKLDRLENYDDTDLKNRIFAVEIENTAQNLEINNVQNDINSTKSSLDDLNSEFNDIKQDISSMYAKNNAQDSEISSIKAKNTEQDTEIYNIKIKDNTQDIEINSIRENLTNVSEEFEDVKNSVSGYDSLIENLNKNVSQYDNRITSLENTNKSQNTEISNNKKNITTNTNNISSIQSSITNLTSKNASQDNEINTLKGNVSTNTNTLKTKADLVNGKIPSSQLPSFVDDVLEYSNKSSFPTTGETGKIYIDLANNTTYRWSGSTYVAIGSSLALGETSSTAYPGNKGKELADSVANINAKNITQDNRLTELEDNYENISASVGTNRADINNLTNDLSGIDDIVKTHDEAITDINYNINNNSTKNQEQDTRLTNLESDVAALKEGGSGSSGDLSEVLSDIADLQELTNKHDTHIADLEGTVTTIQQTDAQQNQTIQKVISQLGGTIEDVSALTERTDIIEEDVNNLERNKADRLSGQIINDKFYTRVTASDSTNSKYEIIEDMGSIQKIGGMSYKSENLSTQANTAPLSTGYFNTTQGAFGYVEKGKVYTFSAYYISSSVTNINLGLRAMSNSDGTGTNLGNLQSIALTTGKRISCTFTAAYSGYIGLTGSNFGATDTLSNITLNEGSTDLGYTPYFFGLRDTKVAALTSTGDNLLVFDDVEETTLNGVNYSVKDGVVTLNGKSTATSTFYLNLPLSKLINAGIYSYNSFFTGTRKVFQARKDGSYVGNIGYSGNDVISNLSISGDFNQIWIPVEAGENVNGLSYSPMLVNGSTAPTEFEQGWMDMITIPTEIQQLDGYGVGMNDEYYNYVDFQNKKFVKQVQKLVLDGSIDETYNLSTADNGNGIANFNITFSSLGLPKFITNGITYYYIANREKQNTLQSATTTEGVYLNQENLFIRVNSSTANTIASLRTYLSNNPVEVAYVIENPIETDLSHIKLDSVYRVSNMGSETLENEYKQKAPSEILYGVDIVPQVIENASNISLIRETMKEFAYQDDVNDLQQEIVNKVDKTKGEIVADTFYSRQTALDSTGSKLEIVDETGVPLKIGGMTYKSENLLVFDDVAETTKNGITYSVKNGVFYYTGTATARVDVNVNLKKEIILNGTYWFALWNNTIDNCGFRFFNGTTLVKGLGHSMINQGYAMTWENQPITSLNLMIESGKSVTNASVSPMIIVGSTKPAQFEKGFIGLRDTKVTEIISTGENLLNLADRELDLNGVKVTCVDGVITLNGTATAASSAYIHENVLLRKKLNVGDKFVASWWFEGIFKNNGIDIMISTYDGTKYDTVGRNSMNVGENKKNVGFTITTGSYLRGVSLYIRSGTVLNNVKVKVMLVSGSTPSTEYKPYWEDVFTIPQDVVDLDDYGVGLNAYDYNYLDLQNKKFVKNVTRQVINGTENWSYLGSQYETSDYVCFIVWGDSTKPKHIATAYNSNLILADNGFNAGFVYGNAVDNQIDMYTNGTETSSRLMLKVLKSRLSSYDVAGLKSYLGANPITIVYPLATPIEIDLSNVRFDAIYNVSNLGSETLINEYNNAVYTEILYGMNVIGQVSENANNISEIRKDLQGLATKKQVNELEQVVSRKADKYKGETVEETFYSRPTGSHFEITDETGSIMKLGGMSHKSSNLLVFDDVPRTVLNGVTYRVQDGVIYLTGTATASASIKFPLSGVGSGSYYFKWEFTGTTSSGVFGYLYSVGHTSQLTLLNTTSVFKREVTLTQEAGDFTVYWQSGAVISNLALKPILVKGSTEPTTWEKGFKGIQNAKVTAISSVGKNLLDFSMLKTMDETAKLQDDDSYISKAANAWMVVKLNAAYVSSIGADRSKEGINFKAGSYYISAKIKVNSGNLCNINSIFILRENTAQIGASLVKKPSSLTNKYQTYISKFTLTENDNIGIGFQVDANASNTVIQIKDIMISSVETDFEPYWEDITEIPQEIQDLDSYGCGINEECYNYVDFQNKKYVKMVGSYTFTGSEGIGQANTNTSGVYRYFTEVLKNLAVGVNASNVKGTLLMADLNTATADETYLKNDGVCIDSNGRLYFFKSDIQSTTDMANYLKGKTIYFALATPTETDISDIKLNQVYRVDNNGMETLVNEYNLSAPTEILYGVNITPQVIENSNDIASLRDEMNEMKQILKELNTALEEDY